MYLLSDCMKCICCASVGMRVALDHAIKCASDGMFASLLTQSSRQVSLALAALSVNM